MSLLDVLCPTPAQMRAAMRQAGRGRSFSYTRQAGGVGKWEKAKLRKARYRANHPGADSNIDKVRAWVDANPERSRDAKKRWANEHTDSINAASRRYRERKRAGNAVICRTGAKPESGVVQGGWG